MECKIVLVRLAGATAAVVEDGALGESADDGFVNMPERVSLR
jgi:hypothetical protein